MTIRTTLISLLQRIGTDSPLNRRRHERVSVLQRVQLLINESSGWISGSVIDCSDSGLGLLSAAKIQPGQRVIVDWKSGYFLGVCRNCQLSGNIWRVGIEMEVLNCHTRLVEDLQQTKWG